MKEDSGTSCFQAAREVPENYEDLTFQPCLPTICTYTHLLHAHFSAHGACTVTSAHLHACAQTRMAQVHEKKCLLHVCHLSPSRLLPPRVSPVFAVPAHSLRHHVPVHLLAELSRPTKRRTRATPHEHRGVWLPGPSPVSTHHQ